MDLTGGVCLALAVDFDKLHLPADDAAAAVQP